MKTNTSRSGKRRLLLGVAVFALMVLISAGSALAHPITNKYEVIARAWSAIGEEYTWGGESWTPDANGYGPDCSGLCLKSWQTTRTMCYKEENGATQTVKCPHSLPWNVNITPRWTSADFASSGVPSPYDWTKISMSSRQMGDVAAYYEAGHGHAVVIHYPNGDGSGDTVIEAPGKCYDVRQTYGFDLLTDGYTIDRRNDFYSYGSNVIVLDNETSARSGPITLYGWRSGSAPSGQYPFNQEYRVLLASESGHARWTPYIESAGYYKIYVWYPAAGSRATAVHYRINYSGGSRDVYVNQCYNGSTWVDLSSAGSVYLGTGYSTYSGSVDLWSGNADGNVAMDAIKFVKQ